jgi:hypothetical protein
VVGAELAASGVELRGDGRAAQSPIGQADCAMQAWQPGSLLAAVAVEAHGEQKGFGDPATRR